LADRHRQPVDRLIAGYLVLTAAALLFPHRPDGAPILLAVHLAIAAVLLSPLPGRARARARRIGAGRTQATGETLTGRSRTRALVGVLADWYPLLIMPLLYWELPFLSVSIWNGHYFDDLVMGWERTLLGGHPSATLATRWESLALSELLHGAYLAYYPVIYFFPAALYLTGRIEGFRRTVFTLMLGFTAHYVVFTLFPVQGPRYLFPAPVGEPASGPLYRLTHAILEGGSSQGAAFPSTHAALAVVQTVNAGRYLPAAAPILALVTIGITIGAVYGGFHYAIDMVTGLAAGLLLAWLAPAARESLR